MQPLVDFLIAHGHAVVFFWVVLAQAGVPLPAAPLLIAAGALAGGGRLDLWLLVLLSVAGSLLSDVAWFLIGRRHGTRVLALLCRISLEPDSCVRRTQESFAAHGMATLVFGKFVPGLSTAAPPLAGLTRMGVARFLWLDGLGALVWSLAFLLPGWAFSDQIERVAAHAALGGAWLLGILVFVVAAWIAVRWLRRWRFLRDLRVARIAPAELSVLLQQQAPLFVVDLRHASDFAVDPDVVPGAVRFDADDLERRHGEIPRDRDVVLYCT
jgi:membrane protein DedA with SNARE-associated domain